MAKSSKKDAKPNVIQMEVDPTECPFREFRDNELSPEFWGMGPAAFRTAAMVPKVATKPTASATITMWVDDQTQPLPRSVRAYLDGWVRAEELAQSRWECEVVVFEEAVDKMSVIDMQLNHAQVLLRSSFCRRVLSYCFLLERVEGLTIEHTWENFACVFGPEGWRPKYHIYSPGMKAGGGTQHRPMVSKNGCYLVRLYHLGLWRCVWVSDQVPVDASGAPLLPFSPLLSNLNMPAKSRMAHTMVTPDVHLWPLLICKALLKLAAPDMNSDEDTEDVDDELMPEFDILHALTGNMSIQYHFNDSEKLWNLITAEVPMFNWDDDEETVASTVKSKSTKKPNAKELTSVKRGAVMSVLIQETRNQPPYALPGITPGCEMVLHVAMARDVPLKKPLPEPEIALWKQYRWVDWARRHGLYENYDCPRTKFLKVSGLMKQSYAPHLLDIQSTESITYVFREEHEKQAKGKLEKDQSPRVEMSAQQREELREWVLYEALQKLILSVTVIYYPSMFDYTTATSSPPIRITKGPPNRALDMPAPKSGPLYLQIDSPETNVLKMSLSMLHPRILLNSGVPVEDYVEKSYLILEVFEWFHDCEIPMAKGFIDTRGYNSLEITFKPGRHFCRLWIHSCMNWQVALLSDSSLLLGSRDLIQCAAVRECPWASNFLTVLGSAFANWIRVSRSNTNIVGTDREFFASYDPDLEWDPKVVGYDKAFRHWMFRQALQSLLKKRLAPSEFEHVSVVLRKHFLDPEFGLPPKPKPPMSLREMIAKDPCDCVMPEAEEIGEIEMMEEQAVSSDNEEKPRVSPHTMEELLTPTTDEVISRICDLATEEVPCGVLKDEREKVIRMHEAATFLQAHWRGTWVRKCLTKHVTVSTEVYKLIMENAFGSLESLSALMNEYFHLYPGAKYAYSVASALSGVYGLHQHHGTAPSSDKCKWIPYFQGVFYCHYPVKVHFDIQSSIQYSTVAVYNNDTGCQMPQAFNAHVTFDFEPNTFGYTVMGHGTLTQPPNHGVVGTSHQIPGHADIHWQLTVLTSVDNVFHICDNPDNDLCTVLPLPSASKLHLDEIFIPNRRNILGGIEISVSKIEAVSFRATASSPDLELEAILRTKNADGVMEELGSCHGTGEICWPYLRLKPLPTPQTLSKKRSISQNQLISGSGVQLKTKPTKPNSAGGKSKSTTKFQNKERPVPIEFKQYFIEVTAPNGWALSLAQWQRVDEVRNSLPVPKPEVSISKKEKGGKEKAGTAKEKKEEKDKPPQFVVHPPLPDDAYIELECSTAVGGGAFAKRNEERDMLFALARRSWDAKEPGRNQRGAQIRQEFRDELLVALPTPKAKSVHEVQVIEEASPEEIEGEGKATQQGPSPATESESLAMEIEAEEEAMYFTMPEILKDKFIPLYFVPLCTRDRNEEETVVLTADMAEAAVKGRHEHLEATLQRMRELQQYNEEFMLGRQKNRCHLLEKLFVDSTWNPDLATVLEERDEAIAQEALERTLSAAKKKQDAKKK